MNQSEVVNHAIVVDKAKLEEGENAFICTECNEPIVVLWNGVGFSLREQDANNPAFGKVEITYTA